MLALFSFAQYISMITYSSGPPSRVLIRETFYHSQHSWSYTAMLLYSATAMVSILDLILIYQHPTNIPDGKFQWRKFCKIIIQSER